MGGHLHIIASCADKKRGLASPSRRLRRHHGRTLAERFDRWWAAISKAEDNGIPATDLYLGPYWATVRNLPEAARASRLRSRLWVASAGYGLVEATTKLHPYSATFASGHEDSIVPSGARDGAAVRAEWWSYLAAAAGPADGAPRRIAEIAGEDPSARFLVLASPSYIEALDEDLRSAVDELRSPERLVIVTGEPGPASEMLRGSWISSVAVLTHHVGGALPSLHARVAQRILEDAPSHGLDASDLRARWTRLAARSPVLEKPNRTPSTDDDVKSFIRESLDAQPTAKHSRLLREYRAAGRACEQARFKELFQSVAGERVS